MYRELQTVFVMTVLCINHVKDAPRLSVMISIRSFEADHGVVEHCTYCDEDDCVGQSYDGIG